MALKYEEFKLASLIGLNRFPKGINFSVGNKAFALANLPIVLAFHSFIINSSVHFDCLREVSNYRSF